MPVSVLVPTIGRPELLRECLASLRACEPPAAEIVIVDQSGGGAVAAVVDAADVAGARVVTDDGRGFARGLNTGLRAAAHDLVLVTNDDCTVAPDWVGVASELARRHPGAVLTGRVLPGGGDADRVPSLRTDTEPVDHTGEVAYGVLYAGNMLLPRHAALALGGFDERPGMRVAAEDCDFCYRWLLAGGALRFEPALLVWHHDWRSPRDLARRYVAYARGQGAFYAKHLWAGDLRMLRFIARDLRMGVHSLAGRVLRRRPAWADPRSGIPAGLVPGLLAGTVQAWRLDGPPWRQRGRRAVSSKQLG